MSIRIIDNTIGRQDTIKGFDIPPGTVFKAVSVGAGNLNPGLYLRIGGTHAKGIVSLTNPREFWVSTNPYVRGYHPVDIDITVTQPF